MRKGLPSPQLYHFETQESYDAAYAMDHPSGDAPEIREDEMRKDV